MGYDLHITRSGSWLDADANPISEAEWHEAVAKDPSLLLSTEDYYEAKDANGGIVRTAAVVWDRDPDVAFWFERSEVTAKNPKDDTIVKLLELASRLNARLLGDEDEEYLPSDDPPGYVVSRDESPRPVSASERPWWRFW
jgi:hypothetical protein